MRALIIAFIAFFAGYATASFTGSSSVSSFADTDAGQRTSAAQAPAVIRSSGREVFLANARGHVEAHAEIDGRGMEVLVDTGASAVVLRESDARRAGHRPHHSDFTVPVNTANGQAFFAPITLRSVELGSIRVRNVQALVARDDDLSTNLLGMSFLGQLESFRFEGRELVLEN